MSIALVRHGSQIAAKTILARCIRPHELCIRPKKHSFAVTRRTSFGPSRWHVKDCGVAFEEWSAERHVLVPRNRPVVGSQVFGTLLAIDHRSRTVDRNSPAKTDLRLAK